MSQNRREFLKTIAAIGASGAAVSSVSPKRAVAQKTKLYMKIGWEF